MRNGIERWRIPLQSARRRETAAKRKFPRAEFLGYVYIYIYIYIRGSLFYFSRKRDMNNDPGKSEGIAVEFLGTGEGEWWRGVVFGNFHLG